MNDREVYGREERRRMHQMDRTNFQFTQGRIVAIIFFAMIIPALMPAIRIAGESFSLRMLLRGEDQLEIAEMIPYLGEYVDGAGNLIAFFVFTGILGILFPVAEGIIALFVREEMVWITAIAGAGANLILKFVVMLRVHLINSAANELIGWFSDEYYQVVSMCVVPLILWFLFQIGAVICALFLKDPDQLGSKLPFADRFTKGGIPNYDQYRQSQSPRMQGADQQYSRPRAPQGRPQYGPARAPQGRPQYGPARAPQGHQQYGPVPQQNMQSPQRQNQFRDPQYRSAERCPFCGAQVRPGNNFCTGCGKDLRPPGQY